MENSPIEIIENETNNSVSVRNSKFTLKQFQSLYSLIKGKPNQLDYRCNKAIQIKIDNFRSLNYKFQQFLESYGACVSESSQVILNYVDDKTISNDSFDKFNAIPSPNQAAIEEIILKYSFALCINGIVEDYDVEIHIRSLVAQHEKIKLNSSEFERALFIASSRITAIAKIKYVDYLIAENLMNTIKKWFDTLPEDESKIYKIQKYSHLIPILLPPILLVIISFICYKQIDTLFPSNITENLIAKNYLIITVLFVTLFKFSKLLSSIIENKIDSICRYSFISLNESDEKLIESTKRYNKKNKIIALLGIMFSIAISIASSYIYDLIKLNILK